MNEIHQAQCRAQAAGKLEKPLGFRPPPERVFLHANEIQHFHTLPPSLMACDQWELGLEDAINALFDVVMSTFFCCQPSENLLQWLE